MGGGNENQASKHTSRQADVKRRKARNGVVDCQAVSPSRAQPPRKTPADISLIQTLYRDDPQNTQTMYCLINLAN